MHSNNSPVHSIFRRLKKEYLETSLLLKNIPATTAVIFTVSVVCMNLLANKTLLQTSWIALDGGVLLSWIAFLCMDVITMHFGPGAATRMAVVAAAVNLPVSLVFYIAGTIPSNAGDYTVLNRVFCSNWFILIGSTVAFIISAAVNNLTNYIMGDIITGAPTSRRTTALRAGISTFTGQFTDNFIFSLIVFAGFAPRFWDGFQWSVIQCAMCACTGAAAETVMEILFWPAGHRIITRWRDDSVGAEYLCRTNGK